MSGQPHSIFVTRALVAVAAAVLMWGGSGVAIKFVGPSGLVTAFYRLWFAIPLLWLVLASRPALCRRLDRRWALACLVGGTLFFVHQVLFFSALKLTTVANVTIIGALQPAVVLLAAGPMFGERATLTTGAWTAVAFCGTALVVLGARATGASSLQGDALAFANLFAFSAYFLASKRVRERVGTWEYVTGMTTVSGLWMLGTVLVAAEDLASPRGWEWLVLAAIAVFPGTLGHTLINWAHAHATALSVSIMLLAVPVIATLGAALVLSEEVVLLQMVGGLVTLAAIGAVLRSMSPSSSEELAVSAAETDAP